MGRVSTTGALPVSDARTAMMLMIRTMFIVNVLVLAVPAAGKP